MKWKKPCNTNSERAFEQVESPQEIQVDCIIEEKKEDSADEEIPDETVEGSECINSTTDLNQSLSFPSLNEDLTTSKLAMKSTNFINQNTSLDLDRCRGEQSSGK